MWNGTAEILKAQAGEHEDQAEDQAELERSPPIAAAISVKLVLPVKP